MKATKLLAAAALVALATTSCDIVKVDPTPENNKKVISVAPAMYSFTKATDTAFEEGDQIGLHIVTDQVYLNNAKYTYNGGALVGEQTNYWHDDEDATASLYAYYPYSANGDFSYLGHDFTINADQTTKEGYTASDLMVATTSSKPTADAVTLPFKHALSKVVITINNGLNDDVAEVLFSNVYGSVRYDYLDHSINPTGSKGTIKALKSGSNTWQLIVAPQVDATPKLIITTTSQKQFAFTIDTPTSFESGKLNTTTITLTKESISTSFTTEVTDWTADKELNFGQTTGDDNGEENDDPVVDTTSPYGVVGTINNWSGDVAMVYENGLYVAKGVEFGAQGEFKIRKDGAWDVCYGGSSQDGSAVDIKGFCTIGMSNILIPEAGTYDIYLSEDLDKGFIAVTKSGEAISADLGLIGAISNWSNDFAKLTYQDGAFVANNVEISGEFKVRQNEAWDHSWGLAQAQTISAGTTYDVFYNGQNLSVEAGRYNVYFTGGTLRLEVITR